MKNYNYTSKVISKLREDARSSILDIARSTNISRAIVFRKMRKIDKYYVKKYTVIPDFKRLGFEIRALFLVAGAGKRMRNFLLRNRHVNSATNISGGYSLMIDSIFRNLSELSAFEEKLGVYCTKRRVHFVVDEIKREAFS